MDTLGAGSGARRGFNALTQDFFGNMVISSTRGVPLVGMPRLAGVVLVIDARHPGLGADLAALLWLEDRRFPLVVVATKGDRLTPTARRRAYRDNEAALRRPVMPVSGKTSDGIDRLWTALLGLVTG